MYPSPVRPFSFYCSVDLEGYSSALEYTAKKLLSKIYDELKYHKGNYSKVHGYKIDYKLVPCDVWHHIFTKVPLSFFILKKAIKNHVPYVFKMYLPVLCLYPTFFPNSGPRSIKLITSTSILSHKNPVEYLRVSDWPKITLQALMAKQRFRLGSPIS